MTSGGGHPDLQNVHEGVSCDGCQSQNFRGNRFKCLRCYDFDLCQRCFNEKRYGEPGQGSRVTVNHQEQHPMQMILTHRDFEIVYEGEPTKNYEHCKIMSFTCPLCSINGFDIRGFIAHVHTHTVTSLFNVLCPICIALPEFDSNREIPDLRGHAIQMHGQHETVYRSEPQRSATRRPMLARRTQRQPAGQATTFAAVGGFQAQPQIVNATTPFGWADMGVEVDEMFRLVNMNRIPNMQSLATTMGLAGQTAQVTANVANANAAGIAHFAQLAAGWNQPIMRDRGFGGTAARTVPLMHGGPSYGEYAQPRQTSAGHPVRAPPAPVGGTAPMRIVRAAPIYPSYSSDEDSQRTPIVSDSYYRNDVFDSIPNSEDSNDDSLEDIPLEHAPVAGELHESDVEFGRDRSKNGENMGSLDNDSEFEFDISCFNKSICNEELSHMKAPTDTTIEPVEPGTEISEKDILRVLRKNITDEEFEEVLAVLNTEFSSGLDVEETASEKEKVRDVGVDVQSWASYQFDICPLKDFGTGGYWSDKRFLRHRKLQREASTASNTEDVLARSEVALAFLRACAGPSAASPNARIYDTECQSLSRPCDPLDLATHSPRPVSVDRILPETGDDERNEILVKVTRRLESECEQMDSGPIPVADVSFSQNSAISGGEDSSDDDEDRSIRQDELQFLAENN